MVLRVQHHRAGPREQGVRVWYERRAPFPVSGKANRHSQMGTCYVLYS